jgi:hypothetical protein
MVLVGRKVLLYLLQGNESLECIDYTHSVFHLTSRIRLLFQYSDSCFEIYHWLRIKSKKPLTAIELNAKLELYSTVSFSLFSVIP